MRLDLLVALGLIFGVALGATGHARLRDRLLKFSVSPSARGSTMLDVRAQTRKFGK